MKIILNYMSNETEIISYIKLHPLYIELEYLLSQIRNLHSIHSSTDDESIKLSKNIINIFGSVKINSNINCLFKLDLYNEIRNPTYYSNGNIVILPFYFHFTWDSFFTSGIKFNLYEVYRHINVDRNLCFKFFDNSDNMCIIGIFFFSEKNTEIVLQESVKLLKDIISITKKTKIQTELINELKLFPVNI